MYICYQPCQSLTSVTNVYMLYLRGETSESPLNCVVLVNVRPLNSAAGGTKSMKMQLFLSGFGVLDNQQWKM